MRILAQHQYVAELLPEENLKTRKEQHMSKQESEHTVTVKVFWDSNTLSNSHRHLISVPGVPGVLTASDVELSAAGIERPPLPYVPRVGDIIRYADDWDYYELVEDSHEGRDRTLPVGGIMRDIENGHEIILIGRTIEAIEVDK
jgi:hypothetical protein